MVASEAGDNVLERRTSLRMWGRFGNHGSLTTTMSVYLSGEFLGGNQPSASLTLWVYLVPDGTMQHTLLMVRDS